MNKIPLTIITVTKNDPEGISRTISSTSLFRDVGVRQIVIDGGESISGRAGGALNQIGLTTVARQPRGIADAFNAGLAAADGEWVWFLNGGDQVDPRLAPGFLREFLECTHADVVIGGITYQGELEPRAHPPQELQWPPFRSWIPHPSTLIRRRLFEKFGGFDPRYSIAMDYEWWLRVLTTGVPVDVVAIPFAIFAAGGVSQRPEMQRLIDREKAHALRRHFASLWMQWLGFNGRLMRAWLRAAFSRRLSRPSDAHD